MEVVRSATCDDLESLFDLIQQASFGLTSLKLTEQQLMERLEWSQFAFTRKAERPGGEPYVLVMEDLESGQLVGTSCIFAKSGGYEPLYAYKLESEIKTSAELDFQIQVELLRLERVHDGPTEIGSLFLMPEYRGHGRGRLLSMSRFALIAQRPKRFAQEVIAEMRGICDDRGVSPFWDAIASHFFPLDFPSADALSTVSKKFIEDLMPSHPIYLALLPSKARDVIGKVHRNTEPALAMLEGEGFRSQGYVDIFDGGPVIHCQRDKIRSVAGCVSAVLAELGESEETYPRQIVSSDVNNFRAAIARVNWLTEGKVSIPEDAADALQVRVGDPLWTLPPGIASR